MCSLRLVNRMWFIVPANSWKNRASSELLYKSNRPQVSMVYFAIIEWGWVGYEEFCRSRRKAEVDNTLRDLQNSSYPAKAEFNNCFIFHSKYFLLLKGVSPLRSLFFRSPNITQPCPQVFAVNGSIICGGLYFWRHWFNMAKILTSLVQ